MACPVVVSLTQVECGARCGPRRAAESSSHGEACARPTTYAGAGWLEFSVAVRRLPHETHDPPRLRTINRLSSVAAHAVHSGQADERRREGRARPVAPSPAPSELVAVQFRARTRGVFSVAFKLSPINRCARRGGNQSRGTSVAALYGLLHSSLIPLLLLPFRCCRSRCSWPGEFARAVLFTVVPIWSTGKPIFYFWWPPRAALLALRWRRRLCECFARLSRVSQRRAPRWNNINNSSRVRAGRVCGNSLT